MRAEHMTRAGNDYTFVTGNYKLQTQARKEWLYVAGDENGRKLTPPESDMEHGREIQPIDKLLQKPLAKDADLTPEEMIAIVMYSGPAFVLYNTVLRRYPEDIYKVFKDGDNLFPTTIFVLVSAINKLSRCMNIPPGTLLYRGLGGSLEFPDSFTRPTMCKTPNALGFLEYGFMSTSAVKSVAVQYSGVKKGMPKATILQIHPNSVDRGADISQFSQYPAEREFLFVPYSFVQGEGRQRTEIVDGGGVLTVVPVRVNINLKTETVQELKEKKKNLHLASARAMVDEVRFELGEWSVSAEAAARLQLDVSRSGTHTTATLAAAVVQQCEVVVTRHEKIEVEQYVNDGVFRALVSEMLDNKAWAKEKKELWMRELSQPIRYLQDWSLRECHRMWQSFLRQSIDGAAASSSERASASVELLISRGLVKRGVQSERNSDEEDVMVQAGGDGWFPSDIAAAAAAGADVGATDGSGRNCVWNAARYAHLESMAALILARADVNKCANDGRSPIFIAARNGHSQAITQLVSAKGDVNRCGDDGWAPISVAAQKGFAACITQLVSASGDVNKCGGKKGDSPICIAAQNGQAACIAQLVCLGGDVNLCNNDGVSPIFIAADKGHTTCITQLLASRADPRSSWKGTSALDRAREKGHTECVRVLEAALT
jgi:hypothetical protein